MTGENWEIEAFGGEIIQYSKDVMKHQGANKRCFSLFNKQLEMQILTKPIYERRGRLL